MFDRIGKSVVKQLKREILWSNVYGLSRSLMALSLLVTLVVNDIRIFFRPAAGIDVFPACTGNISIFCTVPGDYFYLNIIKWICIGVLLLVVIGWRPRITGILHWWVAYSLQVSALGLDGGEQVQAVFTFLLIPITLTDSRKWHWFTDNREINLNRYSGILHASIAFIALFFIRIQVAIIYLNAAVSKVKEEEWLNGTAVYYYLNDTMLGMPPLLANFVNKMLVTDLVVIPTWGTLIIELALFGALFVPKMHRKYFLLLGIILHTFFAIFIGLYSFSLVMCAALILYLRPLEQGFSLNLPHITSKRFSVIQKPTEIDQR
ncbi:sporulation-delaying protein SdpB family protein [Paenibacillus sp. SYP-B4298]|uniref:sporulation-delaying protein SdpB family protein n=1 Tax=Paenibacillus sp. SYP-B4298 TaxID=2996034 RepID=UPI0022DD3BC0|nr:sporulation-delaying protein SdpB family protein [Paenibacillus sp. SYP-B4298]